VTNTGEIYFHSINTAGFMYFYEYICFSGTWHLKYCENDYICRNKTCMMVYNFPPLIYYYYPHQPTSILKRPWSLFFFP
jgi:hypothetical protein